MVMVSREKEGNRMLQNHKFIDGNTLKLIAIITMFIDHLAVFLAKSGADGAFYTTLPYTVMRAIGRTAFPLFAFLLVEGFIYTKSRGRYLISILILAGISEPIYQMFFTEGLDELLHMKHSVNICFELAYSLIMLCILEKIGKVVNESAKASIAQVIIAMLFVLGDTFLPFDYAAGGIILIASLYIFRDMPIRKLLVGYAALQISGNEVFSIFAFILMYFYDGTRGKNIGKLKYLFYAFYPIHLLAFYLLRQI